MVSLIISFFSGFIISLSGGIAPSNMSAVSMQLTIDKSKRAGLWFGLGASIVEMVYIRLYFWGFDTFIKEDTLFLVLQWVMIALFFVIGLIVFIRTLNKKEKKRRKRKDFSNYNAAKSFFLGIFLKAINPLQFVFWTFWSAYLVSNNWLQPTSRHYNVFCLGLGIATFLGYALYVFIGDYLENKSFFSKKIFQRIIGAFLSLTSIAWALKLIVKPEGLVI
jgi:threonine/homoserine/homoserine lactone efflux protein